jgi:hypothetical protein
MRASGSATAAVLRGLLLYYRGNIEFERELAPSRAGFDLF